MPDLTEYHGRLPKYVLGVDRRRLVKITCRGACRGKTRWAEMEIDYPGRAALGRMNERDLIAHCLICGWEAPDPYNWYR